MPYLAGNIPGGLDIANHAVPRCSLLGNKQTTRLLSTQETKTDIFISSTIYEYIGIKSAVRMTLLISGAGLLLYLQRRHT